MISVDRFDIITPQRIGKGIKKEKILYWLGVYRMRVYQPGNRVSNSSLKETFTQLTDFRAFPRWRTTHFQALSINTLSNGIQFPVSPRDHAVKLGA